MAGLSISKAWDETAAFVAREGTLLFPVAFVFSALPSALAGLLMPVELESAKTMAEAMAILQPLMPQVIAALAVTTIIGLFGGLTIYALVLRPGGTSVGDALRIALSHIAAALGATMLLVLGWSVLFSIPFTLAAAGALAPAGLVFLILIPFVIFAAVRLIPVSAVIVAEGRGAIAAITRSWALTRGSFWKLFGFMIVVAIVGAVVSMVSDLLFGFIDLAIGQGKSGVISLLGGALLSTVVSVFLLVMFARIYRQLAD